MKVLLDDMPEQILRLPRKFMGLLDRLVDTRVTPLAYLVLFHNLIFALGFVVFERGGVNETVLARLGIPFGVVVWGTALLVSVVIIWSGLWWRAQKVVMVGAMLGFSVWLGAVITYFWGGRHFQGALGVLTALQYAYFFLAAGLDRLWDYTPVDRHR